jgi:glycosyltransferase involved in cell wall biosynthesis
MMRILHVSPTDIKGGACLGAYNLHKALQRSGADSQMLVLRKFSDDPSVVTRSGPLMATLEALRDPLDRLPLQPYRWEGEAWWSVGWLPISLKPAIDRLQPDIVQFHWVGRGMVPIRELTALRDYSLVWTLRDMWPLTGGCHYSNGCEKYLSGCGACPVLGSTSELDISRWQWRAKRKYWRDLPITYVALSNWLEREAQRSPLVAGKEVVRIANGIDVNRFQPSERIAARAAWGLPEDRQIILYGAQHALSDPRKGFSYLAEALRGLAAQGWGERAMAVVFGADAIEDDFGLPVRFLGEVRNDAALAQLYSAADVMVTPSLYENAAKTVMEALACGTPVTAFANTGQLDLVDHKINGYLATDRSAADLAAGIAWCLEEGRASTILSSQARLKAVSHFNIEAIARDHLVLYERLLATRRERELAASPNRGGNDLLGPLLETPALRATEGRMR